MALRVVIVQQHLAHYRVRFYEVLRELLAEKSVGLDVVYDPNTAGNLIGGNLPWAKPSRIRWFGPLGWQPCLKILRGSELVIVQQETKYALTYLLQLRRRLGSQKLAFWGHGRNFQSENSSILGEQIKRIASTRCDWWFAYNDLSRGIVEELGYPPGRITSVQNSIDMRSIKDSAARLTPADLAGLRASLGIRSENVAVFTGGLYREKRLPFLLDACEFIRREIPDFEIIIIGRGPDSEFIRATAVRNPWVHYVGAKSDTEKLPYWMISKVLLMPGLVGLVVLDSFALGVPMITTDYPDHSPEISYLKDGFNGLIVSPWPDPVEYARRTIELLRDTDRLVSLRANALASSEEYSVERMARNFSEGVMHALAAPKMSRTEMTSAVARRSAAPVAVPRLGVVIRSMSPYLRDFYDAFPVVAQKKWAVRVLIGQRGTDWVNPWDDKLMSLQKTDHVFVNGRIAISKIRTIYPSGKLFAALERFKPTLVLVHEYSPLSIFGALWAVIHRVPWIVASDIGPDYRAPYPRLRVAQKLIHWITNRFSSGTLALTPSSAKRAKRNGKKYLLCPHAIDTRFFVPPEEPRTSAGTVKIIATGNFTHRKGYDLLLRALGGMSADIDAPWELNCYGAGDTKGLQAEASALGITGFVRFSSFLSLSELLAAYQQADIFVLPTRSDTYGVVVHEAAASGLPLVVSKFSGAAEVLVDEGKNGFVVDPEDTALLADRLRRLIGDASLRLSFGLHSRKLAEKWDVRRNAARAIDWLDSFVDSPGSTPGTAL